MVIEALWIPVVVIGHFVCLALFLYGLEHTHGMLSKNWNAMLSSKGFKFCAASVAVASKKPSLNRVSSNTLYQPKLELRTLNAVGRMYSCFIYAESILVSLASLSRDLSRPQQTTVCQE